MSNYDGKSKNVNQDLVSWENSSTVTHGTLDKWKIQERVWGWICGERKRNSVLLEKAISEQRVNWVGDWTGCPVISPELPVFPWTRRTGLSHESVQHSAWCRDPDLLHGGSCMNAQQLKEGRHISTIS